MENVKNITLDGQSCSYNSVHPKEDELAAGLGIGEEILAAMKDEELSESDDLILPYPLKRDFVFTSLFADAELVRPLLEEILGTRLHIIDSTEAQRAVAEDSNMGSGIRYDYFVKADGSPVNIEVQNGRHIDAPRRSRLYSSFLDRDFGISRREYKSVPDTWTIWFVDGRVPAIAPPYAHYRMMCGSSAGMVQLDDGRHVVIIDYTDYQEQNAACREVCRLLSGKRGQSEYGVLLERRLTEMEASEYWKLQAEHRKRELEDAHKEGKAEGIAVTIKLLVDNLVASGVPLVDALVRLGVSPDDYQEILQRLSISGN